MGGYFRFLHKVKGKKYQEKEMLDFKKMVEDSQKKQKSKKG